MASPERSAIVLVVDDSAVFREVAVDLVRDIGLVPATPASTAEEALERIGHGEDVDLVVMDLQLPGMSGAEAAGQIHRLRPELPLLLTSALDPEDAEGLVGKDGIAFVPKAELGRAALLGRLDGGAGTTITEAPSP